ncbi:G20.3 [Citrobacter freundii]|nr:G20.3 [Citrobacter freundii]
MKYELTATEARVIGCLLEKQVTTPEQYPLSVNGVVTACNQKTNREPVMNLSESDVQEQLDNLVKRHFLRTVSGFGNRVTKYEQRFCNSEFGNLKLSAAEVAVITTLLLRGAQTPGELRSRASPYVRIQRYGRSGIDTGKSGNPGRWALCDPPGARAGQT